MSAKSKTWPQFLTAITSGILAVGCGLHFGWPSPTVPKLLLKELAFEVSREEISYIVMIGPFGYLISSPFSLFTVDKIGRKRALLLLAIPQILAWLLIAYATKITMIYAARIIAGAAEGALFTILPVYICEISEPRIRGILGSFFSLGLVFGVLLINGYGSFTSIKNAALISISVPLVFVLTFIWMPESPYFFLMWERIDEARDSLRKLRRIENVESELTQLTLDVKNQISESGTIRDVFRIHSNLKGFLILLGLRTLQQFSGYSAFSFYAQIIFEHVGKSPIINSMIYNTSHLVFVCVGLMMMDKFGRRPLLVLSTLGTTLCLFIEGFYFYCQFYYDTTSFTWVPITNMIIYTMVFDIGLGVVPNVLTGEILSASVKAKALGLLIVCCAVTIGISAKLFEWLHNSFGIHVPFFVFGFCCAAGVVFCYFCIPETRGQSLEQIQRSLQVK